MLTIAFPVNAPLTASESLCHTRSISNNAFNWPIHPPTADPILAKTAEVPTELSNVRIHNKTQLYSETVLTLTIHRYQTNTVTIHKGFNHAESEAGSLNNLLINMFHVEHFNSIFNRHMVYYLHHLIQEASHVHSK